MYKIITFVFFLFTAVESIKVPSTIYVRYNEWLNITIEDKPKAFKVVEHNNKGSIYHESNGTVISSNNDIEYDIHENYTVLTFKNVKPEYETTFFRTKNRYFDKKYHICDENGITLYKEIDIIAVDLMCEYKRNVTVKPIYKKYDSIWFGFWKVASYTIYEGDESTYDFYISCKIENLNKLGVMPRLLWRDITTNKSYDQSLINNYQDHNTLYSVLKLEGEKLRLIIYVENYLDIKWCVQGYHDIPTDKHNIRENENVWYELDSWRWENICFRNVFGPQPYNI